MKTLLLVAAGAVGTIMLAGCATHETTSTTTANPARQTYSSSQLKKTGQPDTAGAIEAVDSSAQIR
jgi:outer membrane murein-binding lipoprotein Lpp